MPLQMVKLKEISIGSKNNYMNKTELLDAVEQGLKKNIISQVDLDLILRLNNLSKTSIGNVAPKKSLDFGKIFSLIGGLIVFLGLSSLVGLYWKDMNSLVRVASTLGTGLLIFSLASYLMIATKQKFTGLALHLVAPILIAFGSTILAFEVILGSGVSYSTTLLANSIIYILIFGLYFAADRFIPSKLFSFVASIAGTVTYWSTILYLIQILNISPILLYENRIFALFGWLYCFVMAVILYFNNRNEPKKVFNDIVTFATSGYFLGNTFWFLSDNLVFEAIFALVLFYSIYISIKINKLAILIVSILGIIIYLTYLSSRYFSNTLGWPIAVIIIGLGFVGSGYLFMNLKEKLH